MLTYKEFREMLSSLECSSALYARSMRDGDTWEEQKRYRTRLETARDNILDWASETFKA